MQHEYVENWNEFAKSTQQPLQKFAELNVKTIQELEYLKPDELTNIKNPQELAEKNVELMLKNGHKIINYMQQSFDIFEKTLKTTLKEVKKKTDEIKK